jgi:hypothetical protein
MCKISAGIVAILCRIVNFLFLDAVDKKECEEIVDEIEARRRDTLPGCERITSLYTRFGGNGGINDFMACRVGIPNF